MSSTLLTDKFWVDKSQYDKAERLYYEFLHKEESICFESKIMDSKVLETQENNGVVVAAQQKVLKSNKAKKSKKMKVDKGGLSLRLKEQSLDRSTSEMCNVNLHNEKNKSKSKPVSSRKQMSQYGDTYIAYKGSGTNSQCTLVSEIAKAREHIKNSLEKMDGIATLAATPVSNEVLDRLISLEKENGDLKQLVENLKNLCLETQKRITQLELKTDVNFKNKNGASSVKKTEPDEDDGVDLFASDSEEENDEAVRIREERLAAYAAKKSKKPALIAKSSLVLDVKPWDDETDLTVMEAEIRKIISDGLLWGASKFLPVAFGINKLSISCVVEDEKVSIDWLTEEIEKLEDYVQSVDVAAFNKI